MNYKQEQRAFAARALHATHGTLVWNSREQGTFIDLAKQARKRESRTRRDALRRDFRMTKKWP